MDLLPSEPLSNYSKSGTDLRFGAPNSDMVLSERGVSMILDGKGSNTSTRNISNLLKAVSLLFDDVTCTGVRNDAGHGEPVCGRRSLREVCQRLAEYRNPLGRSKDKTYSRTCGTAR